MANTITITEKRVDSKGEEVTFAKTLEPTEHLGKTIYLEVGGETEATTYYTSVQEAEEGLGLEADHKIRLINHAQELDRVESTYNASYGDWFTDSPLHKAVMFMVCTEFGFTMDTFGDTEQEVIKAVQADINFGKAELRDSRAEEYKDSDDKDAFYLEYASEIAQYVG